MSPLLERTARESEPTWRLDLRAIVVRGVERRLRLVRFEAGWIASVDTPSGPTLGVDRSPYLAVRWALEPLGVELAEAIIAVGPLPR